MNAYGLSELAPISMTSYGDTEEHIANTVGKPVEGIEIRYGSLRGVSDIIQWKSGYAGTQADPSGTYKGNS